MALEIKSLKRKFKYNGIELDDIDGATLKEIAKHYSGVYPELLNSSPEFVKIENDTEIYEFKKATTGTKG